MPRQSLFLWIVWCAFLGYAFFLAPPDRPDTWGLIQRLSSGQLTDINPAVITLSNLMGIWPMIYSCLLYVDGRGQNIPAWPFAVGMFALGAFVLLPYLALRKPHQPFAGQETWWLKIHSSRILGLLILVASGALVMYGLRSANWPDFWQQWQSSRFIHVMTLDFVMLSLLFPLLLKDDMVKRGMNSSTLFWAVAAIPLIGPACYLVFRPRLQTTRPATESVAVARELG